MGKLNQRNNTTEDVPEQTVKEIMTEWLTAHGYDGLVNDNCNCTVDNLMCCRRDDLDIFTAALVKALNIDVSGCVPVRHGPEKIVLGWQAGLGKEE